MLRLILFFTLMVVACTTQTIQSTNLTAVGIPNDVDERIQNYLPDQNVSITYTTEAHGDIEPAGIEVCYEVVVGEVKLFGLVSKVNGKWFVTEPGELWLRERCPKERVSLSRKNIYFF